MDVDIIAFGVILLPSLAAIITDALGASSVQVAASQAVGQGPHHQAGTRWKPVVR